MKDGFKAVSGFVARRKLCQMKRRILRKINRVTVIDRIMCQSSWRIERETPCLMRWLRSIAQSRDRMVRIHVHCGVPDRREILCRHPAVPVPPRTPPLFHRKRQLHAFVSSSENRPEKKAVKCASDARSGKYPLAGGGMSVDRGLRKKWSEAADLSRRKCLIFQQKKNTLPGTREGRGQGTKHLSPTEAKERRGRNHCRFPTVLPVRCFLKASTCC